jgi:hypothetical protein
MTELGAVSHMFTVTPFDMISLALVVAYLGILGMAFVGNGAAAIWAMVLAIPAGLAGYAVIARLAESH